MALFAATALLLVLTIGSRSAAQARLAEVAAGPSLDIRFSLRDILSYINRPLVPIRRLLGLQGNEDLTYRLSLAGYREPQDADTFLDAKLLCPVLGVLLSTFAGSDLLLYSLGLAALGYFAPDLFLMYATRKRKTAI